MEKTLPIKLPGKKKEEEFTRKFNQMEFSRNLKILKKQSHFKLMATTVQIFCRHFLSANSQMIKNNILNLTNNNGWDYWFVERNGELLSIDEIRKEYRKLEL